MSEISAAVSWFNFDQRQEEHPTFGEVAGKQSASNYKALKVNRIEAIEYSRENYGNVHSDLFSRHKDSSVSTVQPEAFRFEDYHSSSALFLKLILEALPIFAASIAFIALLMMIYGISEASVALTLPSGLAFFGFSLISVLAMVVGNKVR